MESVLYLLILFADALAKLGHRLWVMQSNSRRKERKQAASRFGGGDKCGRCQKTVYFAEAREGPNNIKYHKPCFSCLLCNKSLDSHFAERMQPPCTASSIALVDADA